jgi:hypothetical protein
MAFGFLKKFLPKFLRPKPLTSGFETPEQVDQAIRALTTEDDRVIYAGEEYFFASSNVVSCRYEIEEAKLYVRFWWNALYEYIGPSPEVVLAFIKDNSPGRYHWSHIRGHYAYNKIEEGDTSLPRKSRVIRALPPRPRFRD